MTLPQIKYFQNVKTNKFFILNEENISPMATCQHMRISQKIFTTTVIIHSIYTSISMNLFTYENKRKLSSHSQLFNIYY